MSSSTYEQILQLKGEVEESLTTAKVMQEQWLASNPNDITRRDLDEMEKSFKNNIVKLKLDCQDLEELLTASHNELKSTGVDPQPLREYLDRTCLEIVQMTEQLNDKKTVTKWITKHGLTSSPVTQAKIVTSLVQNPCSKYEALGDDGIEEVQFDKEQLQLSATSNTKVKDSEFISSNYGRNQAQTNNACVFNNALYDHLEEFEARQQSCKDSNSSRIFSNLSDLGRPETNVYISNNEDEVILDMLEGQYNNHQTLDSRGNTHLNFAMRKLLETDRNTLLGTMAFLFSFPILLFFILLA